ncbi:MAG: glycosyltransferase family 9 protein [bacterium]
MIPSIQPFRKRSNWLASIAVEVLAPALRQYARRRTAQDLRPPRQWMKALILGDNHIGDLLYRTCSLRALKSGLPDCDFYYLAAAGSADILAGNPWLKAVLPWARSDSRLDISMEHMQQLRDMHFDAALCTNCIRYWPELSLAISLGIPNRAGYTYKGFSGWVTHPMPILYPQTFPQYFRHYVSALTGNHLPAPIPMVPEIVLSQADEAEASAVWDSLTLGSSRVLACFPADRQNTASWPVEHYVSLFNMLSSRLQVRVVLMGAATDKAFLHDISARASMRIPVISGELSLRGLASFLKRCSIVLAKDSGPRHIANAVGTPALFFRNTASSQIETGTYCDSEVDLVPSGEFLNPRRQKELLMRVNPSEVCSHIVRILSR